MNTASEYGIGPMNSALSIAMCWRVRDSFFSGGSLSIEYLGFFSWWGYRLS
jgi:hypothetical protein